MTNHQIIFMGCTLSFRGGHWLRLYHCRGRLRRWEVRGSMRKTLGLSKATTLFLVVLILEGVIAIGCTNYALGMHALYHILVLGRLDQLLFELIELAKILIVGHSVMLVNVQLIELAWWVRTNHVIRLHLLLLVKLLLLLKVMLCLGVHRWPSNIWRQIVGILMDINHASAINGCPLNVRRLLVDRNFVTPCYSVPRSIGLSGCLLALLIVHTTVLILYWSLNLNCQWRSTSHFLIIIIIYN